MKIDLNHTHRYTTKLNDVSQETISKCVTLDGVDFATLYGKLPLAVTAEIAAMPFQREPRKHTWFYVRPQLCRKGEPDKRSGSFWHIDVDAVYRSVAPDWDDFRAMAVSFGDIAETEFVDEPMQIEVDGPPRSQDYVTFAPIFNDGRERRTSSPEPCQVAEYTIRDVHRAGRIRRDGWRLIVLVFETNAEPAEKWPPPVAPRY